MTSRRLRTHSQRKGTEPITNQSNTLPIKDCMRSSTIVTFLSFFIPLVLCASNTDMLKLKGTNPNGIIALNNENYKSILDETKESFVVALLTATAPGVGCTICMDFESEYNAIVSSWLKDHPNAASNTDDTKTMFFTRADVKDVQNIPEVFKFYQIDYVPRLFLFAPHSDMKDYTMIDIGNEKGNERVLHVINSLKQITGIADFLYYEPTDWSSILITSISTFIIVVLMRKHSSIVIQCFNSRLLWAVLSVFFIILMIGGYMFNQIKKAQFSGVARDGGLIYFLPGQFLNQYAIETQIIGALYVSLTLCVVGLVAGVPYLKKYLKNKQEINFTQVMMPIALAVLIYILFAGYTSAFTIKQSGYPLQLFNVISFKQAT